LPVYLFLAIIVILVYWRVLHDPLIRDDYYLLGQVRPVRALQLWHIFEAMGSFMRPLTILTWWMQFRAFGMEALPSHMINVLFQLANACLLYWFLLKLRLDRLAAFFAALLFAVSPLGTEAVTWSSGRFDEMALFFILLSCGLYVSFLEGHGRLAYAGSLAAALAALLSKESAAIVMLLIPATGMLFRSNDEKAAAGNSGWGAAQKGSLWLEALPFWVIFVVYFFFRLRVLDGIGGAAPLAGTPEPGAVWSSIEALIAPLSSAGSSTAAFVMMFVLVSILILSAVGLMAYRWNSVEAEARRRAVFLLFFFFVSLMPVFTFVFIHGIDRELVNSRYLYIPAAVFLTWLVAVLFEFGPRWESWRPVASILLSGLAIFYIWGLQANNAVWHEAAGVSGYIPARTVELIPDPAPGATIFFDGIPKMTGYNLYEKLTLEPVIRWMYKRDDIEVYVIGADVSAEYAAGKGYLLEYDNREQRLDLVARPPS